MNWGFNLQSLAVLPLVLMAFVYSAWVVMPTSWRRKLALTMARVEWLSRMPAIARAGKAPAGCGCDGCDKSEAAARAGGANTHVVRITRRRQAD